MINYDVIVVGAGHAGCEAALASARLGMQTVVFTVSVDSIAMMPCNPNIGGSSKGHLPKARRTWRHLPSIRPMQHRAPAFSNRPLHRRTD